VALSDADLERIAAIVTAEQPASPEDVWEMPCEVTFVMPTYQSFGTLGLALHHLEWGAQTVPMKAIFGENGSVDGTQDFVRALRDDTPTRAYWLKEWRAIQVVEAPQNEGYPKGMPRILSNMRDLFRAMLPMVDTPYVLTVDADVCVPPGGVRTMLEMLKANEKIGIVGIGYDRRANHVKHGCSMIRAELAQKFTLTEKTCMCQQFCEQAVAMGYEVRHVPAMSARHVKWER
jgi:hypothetical protein